MAKATLLLVDDDDSVRESLAAVLRAEGYVVAEARNGRQAHELLTSNRVSPRLVLLDLLMPIMSGEQFLAAIANEPRLRALPVIVLSAAADEKRLSGVQRVLRKPVLFSSLLRAVEVHCGSAH
jgi:CheY-like chemotaxis protein